MQPNYVPGIGPSNAKLALVGEAPGDDENAQGVPFVGTTGQLVDECLEFAGVSRDQVYLTNVCKYQPPGNDLKKLHLIGYKLEDFIPQLKQEIETLNPNCILAIGNTALSALTGVKGIKHYRGSILPGYYNPKVVGTIHPAALFKQEESAGVLSWKDLTYIKWDFERAYEESKTTILDLPKRNLIIARSYLQFYHFLDRYHNDDIVSVDIETHRTVPICIAFAFSSKEAISVPLFDSSFMTRSDLLRCWAAIADLMANPRIRKITQNGKFDLTLLERCIDGTCLFGMKTYGVFYDTLLAFKTLYPELPGRLEFQTSVLTREPYYKEEGKGFDPKKDKFDRLLLYNAKDACVTFEVFERTLEELRERELESFFFSRVMSLHHFYSRIESRGVKRDTFQQAFLLEKYLAIYKQFNTELDELVTEIAGGDLRKCHVEVGGEKIESIINPNSNGKSGDVPWLVFEVLGLPLRQKTDEKVLDALLRNHCKEEKRARILKLILDLRKVRKVIGTYIEAKSDFRGRLITSVRICLETGRTSNTICKPPTHTEPLGFAFQTLTKHGEFGSDIRSQFVPDDNCIFVEADLSGAEARVVAILADDKKLLKMFEFDIDIHRVTKGWIDQTCPDLTAFFNEEDKETCRQMAKEINKRLKENISDSDRQIGKTLRHAANLGVGKRTASESIGCSEYKAGVFLKRVHSTNPNIQKVFHEGIKAAIKDSRKLVNPFGRERLFLNRWGEDLWKEAFAQIPQSTVSDQTKFAGQRIEKRRKYVQIFGESHDCLSMQVPINKSDDAFRVIKEEMETPIDFKNCTLSRGELIIPVEIKIGVKNWEQMVKI